VLKVKILKSEEVVKVIKVGTGVYKSKAYAVEEKNYEKK
jgi:hypothetical protein